MSPKTETTALTTTWANRPVLYLVDLMVQRGEDLDAILGYLIPEHLDYVGPNLDRHEHRGLMTQGIALHRP